MPGDAHLQSTVRLRTARLPALRWGQAPVFFVAFVTSGILWGTGHDLPSTASITTGRADVRTGVAWLTAMTLLLALAYPMLGLAVSVIRGPRPQTRLMRWLTGWYIRSSTARQCRRRDRLKARSQPERSGWDVMPSVARRFPLSGPLRPTALGNAEAAVADRVYRRYSLDLGLAWPLLATLIPAEDRGRLADAEHRAEVALYSAAGWLVATIWVVPITWVLALFGMTGGTRYWVAAFVAVSVATTLIFYTTRYSQAVTRAIEHGTLMESAVDIYRYVLLETLGFRRPRPDEEREWFTELPALLAGRPIDERYRRDNGTTKDSAVIADLRDTVSQAVRDTVDTDLPEVVAASVLSIVERVVGETLRRQLVGPELDNFDGYLSVSLRDAERVVPTDGQGRALVVHDHDYRLVIVIGAEQLAGAATALVRIRGGNEQPVVPFAVSVDSNVPALRLVEQSFPVART
jgi:hypothetical protein